MNIRYIYSQGQLFEPYTNTPVATIPFGYWLLPKNLYWRYQKQQLFYCLLIIIIQFFLHILLIWILGSDMEFCLINYKNTVSELAEI